MNFFATSRKKFNCNVEAKLICEYRFPCRLFFLLRFFIILFAFGQSKGGDPPAPSPRSATALGSFSINDGNGNDNAIN